MLDTIGIIGIGTIGSKLIPYLASKNYKVMAYNHKNIEMHRSNVQEIYCKRYKCLEDFESKIIFTENINDLSNLPLIIDATPDKYEVKKELYNTLDKICSKETVIGCTTSSLDLNVLAEFYRQDNFFGFHVFNPPDKMQLIELSFHDDVSLMCRDIMNNLKSKLTDKVFVELPIIQGYVVNRLLFVYLNAAYNYHLSTSIDFDKIDSCMKLGINAPMGPFQLSDYIGNDVCLDILKQFYHSLDLPEYKPSKLLSDYVEKGLLGKKVKKGFYEYE